MAVRQILRMGDPRLREIAQPITTFDTPDLPALVHTMQAEDGVGLAAPQIGVGLRILVFGFDSNPRYPDAESVPQTVLVNPVIETLSDESAEGWEGCISVPGLRGMVPRFTHIRY